MKDRMPDRMPQLLKHAGTTGLISHLTSPMNGCAWSHGSTIHIVHIGDEQI
jgi:hypothetical protein